MLRADMNPQSAKRTSTSKPKYFISNKNIFNKGAATSRPESRNRPTVDPDLTNRVLNLTNASSVERPPSSIGKGKPQKVSTGNGGAAYNKQFGLKSYLKKSTDVQQKLLMTNTGGQSLTSQVMKVPLGSSSHIHRKMPSLYLKRDYNTGSNGTYFSRQASVERGMVSVSKDSKDLTQSKHMIVKRNNFVENSNAVVTIETDRYTSGSQSRGGLRNMARYIIPGSDDQHPRATSKENAVHSLNSSVEKLKQTFLIPRITDDNLPLRDEKIKINQSSTRGTQESELTILWRDDIKLDVEAELTFISCLGQGSFAKVYEGYDKRLKQSVAVKVIDKRKILEPKRRALIQTEVNILARMKHKHIGEFFRLIEDHKRLYIVMQLCGNLTLNVFCRQFPDKRLNEEQAYALFSQIAKGVKYMHDHNVAHRDLKLTNILIDEEYTTKVIDFGFACEAGEYHKMYCGTPSYMAPEIVEKKLYNPKPTDVWSLGVILYKLLSGEYAFGGS